MGFFDAIKKVFDSGGIGLHIDTPDEFMWSDGSLPVTVTLTGHKTEPRTVTELRFVMREDYRNDDLNSSATLTFVHTQTLELQPLQEVAVETQFPLEFHASEEAPAGVLGSLMSAETTIPKNAPHYRLTVSTSVSGLGAEKRASTRLQTRSA